MAKVYVSSTRLDLEAERRSVIDWLVLANHQPKHSYVADTDTVRASCLRDVLECDAYVLILGHRYGHVPAQRNPEGRSITELEYRCASAAGKPCIVLTPRGVRDITATDLLQPETYAKVQAFHSVVHAERRVALFGDETELIAALSAGLQQALRANLRDGQQIHHEIALTGKPLTSLHLTWAFQGIDTTLARLLKKGYKGAIDWIMDQQGERSDAQNSAVFREYQLYPFLADLCRRFTKRTRKEENADVAVLFALDDDRNAVLSFGFLDSNKPWVDHDENSTSEPVSMPSLESRGQAEFENTELRNWPRLEANGTNVTITWRLDPLTFVRALSRQNQLISPTADLPGVMRIAILFNIEEFPFVAGNFALAQDQDFWDFREYLEQEDEEGKIFCGKVCGITEEFSSSVKLVPNNSSKVAYEYRLDQVYETLFLNSHDEANPSICCLVFEYTR